MFQSNNDFFWRGDPDENFSDWTVEIVSDQVTEDYAASIRSPDAKKARRSIESTALDGKLIQKYFVHRAVLSCGVRKSKYFAKVFSLSHGRFNESVEHASRIELPPLLAQTIPTLFDYLYSFELLLEHANLNHPTLVALHSLADYFEIDRLHEDSLKEISIILSKKPRGKKAENRCWADDVGLNQIYTSAISVCDDAVVHLVAESVAKKIWFYKGSSRYDHGLHKVFDNELLKCADLDFWLTVASKMKFIAKEKQVWASQLRSRNNMWCEVMGELAKHYSDSFTPEIRHKMWYW